LGFVQKPFGVLAVAPNEVRREPKEPHLLRRVVICSHVPQVVEHAPALRPTVAERVAQCREIRFAEEGGQDRDKEQKHQPGNKEDEAGDHGDDRDHGLRQPQDLDQEADPSIGLSAGPFQLIVRF
jgi:hypothetical protein